MATSSLSQQASVSVLAPTSSPVGSVQDVPIWRDPIAAEARYQLAEFTPDFGAFDIAQLILGLADLNVPVDADLRSAIMKVSLSNKTRAFATRNVHALED